MTTPYGPHFENCLGDFTPHSSPKPNVEALKNRILNIINTMIDKFPAVPKNPQTESESSTYFSLIVIASCDVVAGKAEGGLYAGLGGMAYCLWHTAHSGLFPEHNAHFLQTAKLYMEICLGKLSEKHVDCFNEVSFLLGNVGNYLSAAFVYEALGERGKHKSELRFFSEFAKLVCQ